MGAQYIVKKQIKMSDILPKNSIFLEDKKLKIVTLYKLKIFKIDNFERKIVKSNKKQMQRHLFLERVYVVFLWLNYNYFVSLVFKNF